MKINKEKNKKKSCGRTCGLLILSSRRSRVRLVDVVLMDLKRKRRKKKKSRLCHTLSPATPP